MKTLFLKLVAFWRRFRRDAGAGPHLHYAPQVEALMSRVNPFAPWDERANWMIDSVEWLRREPRMAGRPRQQRIRFLLDWLDQHREVRRLVQTTLQKTLREASGPELFSATGLPQEPAFFSELNERIARKILPRAPANMDLSALFTAMFPKPADADWLRGLDHEVLQRIWKLAADGGIAHAYQKQIDEALTYLVTLVVSVGISPAFRQRLGAKLPLQATPFMALRRELEKYLMARASDPAALRSVRMLVAVCRAQTDKIYAHLDEYGVSVSLVYRVERMRAQLIRIGRLIDLRAASHDGEDTVQQQAQALLGDLITAHHHRSSIRRLAGRSFSLLALKMVERNAEHGDHYRARDRAEYRAVLRAGVIGGGVIALAVLGQHLLSGVNLAHFFEGALISLGYALALLAVTAVGGTLAARQPAVTGPALAARMGALDTVAGLRGLLTEAASLLRAQVAALGGNLLAVMPLVTLLVLMLAWWHGGGVLDPAQAHDELRRLSLIGPTPLFAVATGVLLWLAGLSAGFADNWFALRRLRQALAQHRRLVYIFGSARTERWAAWLERNLACIAGNIALALLLGMTPVVAQFFGIPLDVRHVTFAAGALAAAAASLGWQVLSTPEFWLAGAGIALIGVLNIAVAFACALALALSARDVPRQRRRLVLRILLRRMWATPRFFLRAPSGGAAAVRTTPELAADAAHSGRSQSGS